MSSTNFTDHDTIVQASWLNDVDAAVYQAASGLTGSPSDRTALSKFADYVSVLDYGADKTGVANSTTAFNNAIATGKRVFVPKGTYSVSDISVVSHMHVEGESNGRTGASILEVRTNSTAAFRHSQSNIVENVTLKNLRIKAASGVTNAKAYRQDDKAQYLASSVFDGLDTYKDLVISYDGYFIVTTWINCQDGYNGTSPGAQEHQMITSIPATFGQANQTNLCQLTNTHVHRATSGVSAAVDIAYGSNWSFNNGTRFEDMDCPAIRARGIFEGNIDECWIEQVRASHVVVLDDSPAPNAQGSRTWSVTQSTIDLTGFTGTHMINLSGVCTMSINTLAVIAVPASVFLVTAPSKLSELYQVVAVSGAGASGFLTDMRAQRSSVEFLTDVINSPQAANQNVLPIGPSGLGQANFTNSGPSGKADVASGIGLAGNAVSFTLGASDNMAYYSFPSKLVTYLRSKTITLAIFGYAGTAATSDALKATVWDSVSPAAGNGTQGTTITVNSTALQLSYVTITVGASASALHVGFYVGGLNNGQTFILETMGVYLGKLNPQGMSIR